jgi:DNA-directed RNA polymerase specialized sigma24 family protein
LWRSRRRGAGLLRASLDPEGAPAWLRTVVKHEALAIRAARRRIVGPADVDLDATEARELEPAHERAASGWAARPRCCPG